MSGAAADFATWRARAAAMAPETRAFVDGAYVDAIDGGTFERVSPIDGRVVAAVARCRAADVDRAVAAARRAFEAGRWRDAPPEERKAVLRRFAELIRGHGDELALLEAVELGKPISDALAVDIPSCARAIDYYAEYADKLYEEIAPTGPDDLALIRRMPLGVVAAIVPWNYPLIIAGWKIGPALAMGNSVILKPAEASSLGAIRLGALAREAGLPDGVLNVVPGFGAEAGQALAEHRDVDLIAFTGSTATGRSIMAAAAASNLKRVALELGGKSPQIVLADCPDLDACASAIAWGIFYNAGQTCHAGSRLIVQRPVAEALYEKVIAVTAGLRRGHPLDPATQIGALISDQHRAKVMGYLDIARGDGSTILMGGAADAPVAGGAYVQPTLIANPPAGSPLLTEEIFGPVLTAIEVDSADEALAIANASDFGLAASVWTSDMRTAHRLSSALRAGTVWINCYDRAGMATPFGGFRQSGFGRDRSHHALDKYADLKTVWTYFG